MRIKTGVTTVYGIVCFLFINLNWNISCEIIPQRAGRCFLLFSVVFIFYSCVCHLVFFFFGTLLFHTLTHTVRQHQSPDSVFVHNKVCLNHFLGRENKNVGTSEMSLHCIVAAHLGSRGSRRSKVNRILEREAVFLNWFYATVLKRSKRYRQKVMKGSDRKSVV